MAHKPEEKFELSKTAQAFALCLVDGDAQRVILDEYISSYSELYKFLGMMGTVFSFVASDVHSKLKILQTFRQSEKSSHYEDVKSMAKYETENSVIKTEGNGCRTLLRLHRALLFIIKLFEDISNASNHDSMATVAHNAYSATLAQYHTWLIRKAVGVAVYTLPSRQSFLQKFGASTEQETLDQVKDLVGKMYTVYNEVQKIYEEYNILQLP